VISISHVGDYEDDIFLQYCSIQSRRSRPKLQWCLFRPSPVWFWWWRQQGPQKHQSTSTRLHGALSQKAVVFTLMLFFWTVALCVLVGRVRIASQPKRTTLHHLREILKSRIVSTYHFHTLHKPNVVSHYYMQRDNRYEVWYFQILIRKMKFTWLCYYTVLWLWYIWHSPVKQVTV
jgi:hypothetical protein